MAYRHFTPLTAKRGVAWGNSNNNHEDSSSAGGSISINKHLTNSNHPHNNNSSASSDFFSPISMAFFGGKVLPHSHDTSWIGARQSPIPSFDNEDDEHDEEDDDDDDDKLTRAYHRALHESLEAADFANERTRLLQQRKSPLHPLWDGATQEEREKAVPCKILWGDVLISISGIYWLSLTVYEACYTLLSSRDNDEDGTSNNTTVGSAILSWILFAFDTRSYPLLITAGAFAPHRILLYYYREIWRIPASMCLCSSLPQWILLCVGWRLVCGSALRRSRTFRYAWMGTFIASTIVGQLWMMAWDKNRLNATTGNYNYDSYTAVDDVNTSRDSSSGAIATCATWGMCGVLTAVGIHRPEQRAILFLPPIFALLLALWEQPFNSVYGVSGASFMGWGLAVTTATPAVLANSRWNINNQQRNRHRWEPLDYLRMVLVLAMLIVPLLSIAFQTT